MTPQSDYKAYRWQRFALATPGEWEMLQFARSAEAGRCSWADRYAFRLEMHWRLVQGPPDWERMFKDYTSRLVSQGEEMVTPHCQHGAWRGLATRQSGLLIQRYGCYVAPRQCLVEMVFLGMAPEDDEVKSVLDSFQAEEIRNGCERWTAFGLDARVAAGRCLAECRIEPARAQMRFAAGDEEEVYERLGLVAHWLAEPLAAWHRRRIPTFCDLACEREEEEAGHRIHILRGQRRRPGALGRWRSRLNYESLAWRCAADGRIYRQAIASAEAREFAARRLACCAALGWREK